MAGDNAGPVECAKTTKCKQLLQAWLFVSLCINNFPYKLFDCLDHLIIQTMFLVKEFKHLQIPLQDIKSATNNFDDTNCIGRGGFGKVYQGELLISEKLTRVAVKRLDSRLGQGTTEFWKEIMMLSHYKHENLVSLLGFCDEGHENILVYEYLPNKSLDLYLNNNNLSWNQRLRICIGAAHGLQYLHEPAVGSQQRVLHRDIKSANILLDQNWNAKISDFGLSKFGPANQQYTFLFSNAVGTMGYCDPLYAQTGFLTKESDIYSFGVVLFEVLCGRHCLQNFEDIRRFLTVLARKCYEEKTLDTIIDTRVKEQISSHCLQRFSTIAYQCLRIDRTERPSVSKIVKELEFALQYQVENDFEKAKKSQQHEVVDYNSDIYWETKLPRDWEVIVKMFKIPHAIYSVKKELFSHLQKGLCFDEGNKFFWINDFGKKCVLLSARRFLDRDQTTWVFQRDLRFSRVAEYSNGKFHDIKCRIRTSMLSLGTMYAASLVFKYRGYMDTDIIQFATMRIEWKMEDLNIHSTHYTKLISDNWYKMELWNFINHGPDADFDIVLEKLSHFDYPVNGDLLIQGIEFQPIDMYDQDIEEFKIVPITDEEVIDDDDDGEYWEKKLPDDYNRYIAMSDKPLDYTTRKELYLCLSEGFLSDNGHLWLSLCESTQRICCMLPATKIIRDDPNYLPLAIRSISESRFNQVIKLRARLWFTFEYRLWSPIFSPQYTYACFLVFKFEYNYTRPHDTRLFKAKCKLDGVYHDKMDAYLSLCPVNIPTIKPKNGHGSDDTSNIPRNEGLRMLKGHIGSLDSSRIKRRKDGWMEVRLCKPLHHLENHKSLEITLSKSDVFYGMILEGVEFRPSI